MVVLAGSMGVHLASRSHHKACCQSDIYSTIAVSPASTGHHAVQVQTLEPADRVLSEGSEVLVGAPVLLVHCATGNPLHLEEGFRFPTDFGSEHEVTAYAASKPLLAQNLEAVVKVRGSVRRWRVRGWGEGVEMVGDMGRRWRL